MDAMKGSTPAELASGDYLERVVGGLGTVAGTVGVVCDV
jgi:hypothetical protein